MPEHKFPVNPEAPTSPKAWSERRALILDIMNRCGICGDTPMFNWSGRQGQLCKTCQSRAVDSQQNQLIISHSIGQSESGSGLIGYSIRHVETDPVSGERDSCQEVIGSRICWVDGIKCQVVWGRMSGIGLMVADFPQLRLGPEIEPD
jgi:hypothetical protein